MFDIPDDFSTVIVLLTLGEEPTLLVEERWMTRCLPALTGRELVS
jgi:hypothetical protein